MTTVLRSLLLPLVALACATAAQSPRPNFLIILSDDQGYDDLSSHGNRMAETPRLDRLASQSLEFTQFYVEPACAPTRASLLTGRSFLRTGVWSVHFGGDYVSLGETTFADRLGAAGYATGICGKWHSGKTPGYLPGDRGFQQVAIAELYVHKNNGYRIGDAPKALADTPPYRSQVTPAYATDRLADSAIAFLRENKARPFCLYLPAIAVHSPWEAPAELIAKYRAKGCSARLAALYGLLEQLDASIGRVLDELDALGLADDTVVLFFSDNGAVHKTVGTHAGGLSPEEIAQRNVSRLRGTKGTIFEGGIRSPLLVRWPGRISPGKTEVVAQATDLFPTLMELAGIAPAAGAKPLDGSSLAPLLLGKRRDLGDRILFGSELGIPSPSRAKGATIRKGLDLEEDRAGVSYERARLWARSQRFKLVKRGPNAELFDMASDPSETTDVLARFPEEAARLEAALRRWYGGILANDRPYREPLYLVGRPGAPGAVLHFNGARKLTGDFSGNGEWAHSLSARKAGSTATFSVRVVTPGRYRVILQADVTEPGNEAGLACGGAGAFATLTPGDLHELGILEVPSGAGELVFRYRRAGPSGIAHFWNIVLLRAP